MKQLITNFRNNTPLLHKNPDWNKWPPILLNMAKAAFPYVPFTTLQQALNQQLPVTVNEIACMQEQNRYYRYTNVVTKKAIRKQAEAN
jgi:hypothetical protein